MPTKTKKYKDYLNMYDSVTREEVIVSQAKFHWTAAFIYCW